MPNLKKEVVEILVCPFTPKCGFKANDVQILQCHLKETHDETPQVLIEKDYECPMAPVCTFRTRFQSDIGIHYETTHVEDSPFVVKDEGSTAGPSSSAAVNVFDYQVHTGEPSSSSSSQNAPSSKNSEAEPEMILCDWVGCSEYVSMQDIDQHLKTHKAQDTDTVMSDLRSQSNEGLKPARMVSTEFRASPKRRLSSADASSAPDDLSHCNMGDGENIQIEGVKKKRKRHVGSSDFLKENRDKTQKGMNILELGNSSSEGDDSTDGSSAGDSLDNPIRFSSPAVSASPLDISTAPLEYSHVMAEEAQIDPDFAQSFYAPIYSRSEASMGGSSPYPLPTNDNAKEGNTSGLLRNIFRSTNSHAAPNMDAASAKERVSAVSQNDATPVLGEAATARTTRRQSILGQESLENRASSSQVQQAKQELPVKGRKRSNTSGPYSSEDRAPEKVLAVLREGGVVEKETAKSRNGVAKIDKIVTHLNVDGKSISLPKIKNETQGLIPLLGRLCEIEPYLHRAYLCHPEVRHFTKEASNTNGFCGYRTIQMMMSYCQAVPVEGAERFFNKRSPTVIQLQELIEEAWDKGIETHNREELGPLLNTRKYIGTSEAAALFKNLGIKKRANIFPGENKFAYGGKYAGAEELFEFVWDHFSNNLRDIQGKIIYTDKAPLYLQFRGHSIAIVGVQKFTDNTTALLVFDSAHPTSSSIKNLLNLKDHDLSKVLSKDKNPLKHIKNYKRILGSFKEDVFESLYIQPDATAGSATDPVFSISSASDNGSSSNSRIISQPHARAHVSCIDPAIRERLEKSLEREYQAKVLKAEQAKQARANTHRKKKEDQMRKAATARESKARQTSSRASSPPKIAADAVTAAAQDSRSPIRKPSKPKPTPTPPSRPRTRSSMINP